LSGLLARLVGHVSFNWEVWVFHNTTDEFVAVFSCIQVGINVKKKPLRDIAAL
jgi:hypothetical protein